MTQIEYEMLKLIIDSEHSNNHNLCGQQNSVSSILNPLKVKALISLYDLSYIARYTCPISKWTHYLPTPIGKQAFMTYQADD